jgi:hypothetical protein
VREPSSKLSLKHKGFGRQKASKHSLALPETPTVGTLTRNELRQISHTLPVRAGRVFFCADAFIRSARAALLNDHGEKSRRVARPPTEAGDLNLLVANRPYQGSDDHECGENHPILNDYAKDRVAMNQEIADHERFPRNILFCYFSMADSRSGGKSYPGTVHP